jgi:pilus assembly protein CpaB
MKKPVAAALIFLVAAAAAGGVLLFMNGVRERAEAGRITADVIVATRDIPAGQELSVLIDEGVFRTKSVDVEDLVPGAITDVYQLQGQRTGYPILAEEQIVAARLAGPLQAGGGVLGIPDGFQAASITLEPQRVVAGAIQQGDHVEVFGTFSARSGAGTLSTHVVIDDALVLAIARPESADVGTNSAGTVTLAVTPEQAALLIFAQEQGHVWLTLLPPNQAGVHVPPVELGAMR